MDRWIDGQWPTKWDGFDWKYGIWVYLPQKNWVLMGILFLTCDFGGTQFSDKPPDASLAIVNTWTANGSDWRLTFEHKKIEFFNHFPGFPFLNVGATLFHINRPLGLQPGSSAFHLALQQLGRCKGGQTQLRQLFLQPAKSMIRGVHWTQYATIPEISGRVFIRFRDPFQLSLAEATIAWAPISP